MPKKIGVSDGSWALSDIGGADVIGLEKTTGGARVLILRWKEGVGRHQKWRVFYDPRIRVGSNLLAYKGKRVDTRWRVVSRNEQHFEIEEVT